MGFNFPSSPTVGQTYPVPPIANVPVYTWDGEKWTMPGTASVPSAPYDAMAYSGMQINGGMEVSQEKGTAVTTVSGYVIDGWVLARAGTMGVSTGQNSGGVFPPLGFANNLALGVTTAQASLGATDYTCFMQQIEGYRIARLAWGTANAQSITIGFWSSHFRTGVYSGVVRNGGAINRGYGFTYTHNISNTPQYNTVTIPGDTTGTWAIDNTIGMTVIFAVGCGTTYTTPSVNTWVAGNYLAALGQVNGVAATSDVFRITGVTVLPGTQAPTAAQSPNIMRPYDQELVTCQRYYEKCQTNVYGGAPPAGSNGHVSWFFKVYKRTTPTIVLGASSSPNLYQTGVDSINVYTVGSSGVVAANTTADARL